MICMNIHIYIYACMIMYACMHVCMYDHVCMYVYTIFTHKYSRHKLYHTFIHKSLKRRKKHVSDDLRPRVCFPSLTFPDMSRAAFDVHLHAVHAAQQGIHPMLHLNTGIHGMFIAPVHPTQFFWGFPSIGKPLEWMVYVMETPSGTG